MTLINFDLLLKYFDYDFNKVIILYLSLLIIFIIVIIMTNETKEDKNN